MLGLTTKGRTVNSIRYNTATGRISRRLAESVHTNKQHYSRIWTGNKYYKNKGHGNQTRVTTSLYKYKTKWRHTGTS